MQSDILRIKSERSWSFSELARQTRINRVTLWRLANVPDYRPRIPPEHIDRLNRKIAEFTSRTSIAGPPARNPFALHR